MELSAILTEIDGNIFFVASSNIDMNRSEEIYAVDTGTNSFPLEIRRNIPSDHSGSTFASCDLVDSSEPGVFEALSKRDRADAAVATLSSVCLASLRKRVAEPYGNDPLIEHDPLRIRHMSVSSPWICSQT